MFILLHAFPKSFHLRSVADSFDHKSGATYSACSTDTEYFLHKFRMSVVVQIEKANWYSGFQKAWKVQKQMYSRPLPYRLSDKGKKQQEYRHLLSYRAGYYSPTGTKGVSPFSTHTSNARLFEVLTSFVLPPGLYTYNKEYFHKSPV